MEIVMALAAPVLISFLLWMAASAASASTLPSVGYGIGTATSANGVSCIWVGNSTSTCGGGLAAPTFFVTLFNGILLFIVFIVVIIQGVKLAATALESDRD